MTSVLLLLLSLSAQASPVYPSELQEAVGADCLPPCTVCHQTLAGGAGTVVQPFGEALVDRGLTGGGDVDLLLDVLADADADGQDVDDDGVSDLDALADGVDPNPDGQAFCELEQPVYGCFSHTGAAPAGLLALLALGMTGFRRRR